MESIAWFIALREILKHRQTGENFWKSLRSNKDPSVFVVFGEDTAAMSGLLVGETADQNTVKGINSLVLSHSAVEKLRRPLTMHLGPSEILLNQDVQFKDSIRTSRMVKVIDEFETQIQDEYPSVSQIFIEVEGLKGHGHGSGPD